MFPSAYGSNIRHTRTTLARTSIRECTDFVRSMIGRHFKQLGALWRCLSVRDVSLNHLTASKADTVLCGGSYRNMVKAQAACFIILQLPPTTQSKDEWAADELYSAAARGT